MKNNKFSWVKNETMARIEKLMGLKIIILGEVNQIQKEKYHILSY